MIAVENFQVRGLPGEVHKVRFGSRTVDYWSPREPSEHILIALDGQNVLDKRNIPINPHQRATWELGQSALKVFAKHGLTAPTVICVYHTPYLSDNLGRLKEYVPAQYMSKSENWSQESHGLYQGNVDSFLATLTADQHVAELKDVIVPTIAGELGQEITPEKTAILGASMGGLAAIYSLIKEPDYFHTALSFSPHWVIGGDQLAEKMMQDIPAPGRHKLWMSRGTKGLDALYENSQDLADRLIKAKGYKENSDFMRRTLNRGAHSNATWARYAPAALDFWLKKGSK